jgi:hypothetical protein
MGTNFYLESTACMPSAFERPRIHIGKSSAGWCFALHVYPSSGEDVDHRPANFGQWCGLLESTEADGSARVVDEYGTEITVAEMIETITVRSFSRSFPSTHYTNAADFHEVNHSDPGPHGLVRHQIDGIYCLAHGEGTWDYLVGDFL